MPNHLKKFKKTMEATEVAESTKRKICIYSIIRENPKIPGARDFSLRSK